MKKFLLFAGIFVATIAVVLLIGRKAPLQKITTITPTPTIDIALVPTIPATAITNKQRVVFSISSLPEVYPPSLGVYTATRRAISVDAARAIASSFGFSGNPQASTTTVGLEYIWLAGKKQLSISDNPPSVSYRDEQPSSPPGPDATSAAEGVVRFLTAKQLLSGAASLIPLQTKYFLINDIANREESQARGNLALVSYQYKIGDYPLYQQERYAASVTALVGANNYFRSVAVTLPPVATLLGEKPVVSPAQAAIMLQNDKGSLVSISGKSYDTAVSPSFVQVDINATYIAYFEEKKSSTLVPVYVFEGVVSGGDSLVNGAHAVYMVPATQ